MPAPAITVLMPLHNSAAYVAAAISSILRQTFRDFELLIIDDGSTDGGGEIAHTISDPRIRLLQHQKNQGVAATLNHGLEEARGTYIARMDADDLAEPQRLALQFSCLNQDPILGLIGSWAVVINSADICVDRIRLPTRDDTIRICLLSGNQFVHSAVMFPRKILDTIGPYHDHYPHAEDYNLWLRVSDHFTVANIPRYLLQWRRHPAGMSHEYQSTQRVSADNVRRDYLQQLLGRRTDGYDRLLHAIRINPQDSLLRDFLSDRRPYHLTPVRAWRWRWWKFSAALRQGGKLIMKWLIPNWIIDLIRAHR